LCPACTLFLGSRLHLSPRQARPWHCNSQASWPKAGWPDGEGSFEMWQQNERPRHQFDFKECSMRSAGNGTAHLDALAWPCLPPVRGCLQTARAAFANVVGPDPCNTTRLCRARGDASGGLVRQTYSRRPCGKRQHAVFDAGSPYARPKKFGQNRWMSIADQAADCEAYASEFHVALRTERKQVVNSSHPCGNLQRVRDLLVPVPFAESDMQEILQQTLQIWRVWTLVEEKLLMLLAHPATDLQA